MRKTFIALVAALSLPVSALAQRAPALTDATAPSEATCSFSSDGSASSLDFSWGASQPSNPIGQVLRVISTPSSSGGAPTISAHAINTKGTGSQNNRMTNPAGGPDVKAHAINTKGTGCQNGRISADAAKAPEGLACRINPGKGVTIFNPPPPPIADKVAVQNFQFTGAYPSNSRMSGPGGGPRVQAIVCSGPDGGPSDIAMLLLPAVRAVD